MQREIDSLKMNERELKLQISNLKEDILDLKSSETRLKCDMDLKQSEIVNRSFVS